MSRITVPDVGEVNMLKQLRLGWVGSYQLYMRLFTNDFTPGPLTVYTDFVQPVLSGYNQQMLTTWSVVTTDPDGLAYTLANTATFTASAGSPVTVYGYFITDVSGALFWCERWDVAKTYGPTSPVESPTLMRLRQIP